VLLECTAGGFADAFTKGFDRSCLNDLPSKLANAGISISLADVWNRASIVHGGQLKGWEGYDYSYDSRSRWERIASKAVSMMPFGIGNGMSLVVDASRAARFSSMHNDVLRSKCAGKAISNNFYP